MTTYTKSDLATRILRDTGLIGAEEIPSAVDLLFVEETIDSEIPLLAKMGIVIWDGSAVQVPDTYFTVLSRRIGIAISPPFGLMDIPTAISAMNLAEKDLRHISAVEGTGATLQNEFF